MPLGSDPFPPPPTHRVRWAPALEGDVWLEVLEAPRVEEGVLVLRPAQGRALWVPLRTITGPIEIQQV
ncbi:hypothetical protein [Streptomyces thermolilacinus]|uniref:hypothetical protein n=1 Tax=Streptomyces thermolilacinus TaxID=285540 RepID=UPI0033F087A9